LSEHIKTCWILTEGLIGTENQCRGLADSLAESLGLQLVIKRVQMKFPWKQLGPWLGWGHQFALTADSDSIDPPYPDILIASGRKSIGLALHIKKRSGGKTFLVQVQDPRISPKHFDLVIVPQHDPVRGENVVVTTGAMHRVTPEKIASEKEKFPALEALPHPRVAVLIGGASRAHRMTAAVTNKLVDQLLTLTKKYGASLMVTVSRRTGPENTRVLREALKGQNIYFWDGIGDTPFFAMLGFADYIVVTEDSVSMPSEALSTGKPVYIASLEGGGKRLNLFHKLLQEQGYTRPFTGELEKWSYEPPHDTLKAVTEIQRRLQGTDHV
jgi:mitochondrial fission protein ELM1